MATTVVDWLGAEFEHFGVKRSLGTKMKAALRDAAIAGSWEMDDIPSFAAMDEVHVDGACKMLKKFFATLVTDLESEAAARAAKASSTTSLEFSRLEKMRLDEWLDGFVQATKKPSATAATLTKAQSEQMQRDLAAQGMSDQSDLLWFELTKHTGRPAAPGDTEGGVYLGQATSTKGGVAHRKAGGETYGKTLEKAVAAGDFSRMERWYEHLVDVLGSSEHRFAGQAAMLMMGMLQKLTSTLGSGEHALLYLQLHEDNYVGRGFPNGKFIDDSIYKQVMGRTLGASVKDLGSLSVGARAPSTTAGSTVSGSSSYTASSLGTSVSEKPSQIEGQLSDVLKAVGVVSAKLDEQGEKISGVTRRLQSVEDKVAHQAKGPQCHNCKQWGHTAANCPQKKKEGE